jgi:AcrR family transcriptional regulator
VSPGATATAGRRSTSAATILEAAGEEFLLTGFRRTSMEAIAERAGLARQTLYLHFSSKEEVFTETVARLHESYLARAEVAAAGDEPAARALRDAIQAKVDTYSSVVFSPHGEELMDAQSRLCGEIVERSQRRYNAALQAIIAAADARGEIALEDHGLSAGGAAELLYDWVAGIMRPTRRLSERAYARRVEDVAETFVRGVAR